MNAVRSRIALAVVTLVTAGGFGSGCAFASLHSPRPNEPGEVSLGAHASAIVVDGVAPVVTGTARVGVAPGSELGLNLGSLGGELAYKYGFMESAERLQASLIAGAGAYGWAIPDINVGALIGYQVSDAVMPFGGFRPHLLIAGGVQPAFQGIAGVEFFIGRVVSVMCEFDYTAVIGVDGDGDDDIDIDYAGVSVFSVGLRFSIGGDD